MYYIQHPVIACEKNYYKNWLMSWTFTKKIPWSKIITNGIFTHQKSWISVADWFWSAIFCSVVIAGICGKSLLEFGVFSCGELICKLANLIKIFLWNIISQNEKWEMRNGGKIFRWVSRASAHLTCWEVSSNCCGNHSFSSIKSLLITPGINCINMNHRNPYLSHFLWKILS